MEAKERVTQRELETFFQYILGEFPMILNVTYLHNGNFTCTKVHENRNVYFVFDKRKRYYLSQFGYDVFVLCSEEKSLGDIIEEIEVKYYNNLDKEAILGNVCVHISSLITKGIIKKKKVVMEIIS
ncbi:hypothetical protein LGL55_18470 [Clostridium tagluense]|uniref:hypothetical protein n=1 Tax=Clostridium tagluense TaxID=360422 RepID=UPI001CF45601|nr:hypothetical protein [Clostridium tagluense]MCB2313239.1 hypothetical protein [Clostridium tagluense]MCB2318010.1 hypothetical protein [Clostridium tagluense]MCB2322794.1 hypothetical protein [Clostridium tagluense]MCB2327794.1 hypothetical protein [Clostridium tagluense]MCB2332441.1 hypothetical protein [Clostridium tagluense]